MKKLLLLLLLSLSLLAACTKKDGNGLYNAQITGVNFRDISASPAGTLGNPDVKTSGQGISFVVYPIPCATQINFIIGTTQSAGLSAKVKLLSAIYQGAPSNVNIENNAMAGVIVREMDVANLNGQNMFSMNLADLRQGFYRIYLELSNGEVYRDNIMIAR